MIGAEYAARHTRGVPPLHARVPVSASAASGNLTQRVRYILASDAPAALGAAKALVADDRNDRASPTVPLFAGAVGRHRAPAELLAPEFAHAGLRRSLHLARRRQAGLPAAGHRRRDGVIIRNSSLRDLIALAYGVERWQVSGDGQWLDSPAMTYAS